MEGSEVEWVTGQLCIPPLSAVKVGAKMCIEESDSVLVEETEKYIVVQILADPEQLFFATLKTKMD